MLRNEGRYSRYLVHRARDDLFQNIRGRDQSYFAKPRGKAHVNQEESRMRDYRGRARQIARPFIGRERSARIATRSLVPRARAT